jgi:CubicO group peptidase (beta-lactamase class C family)
VHDENAEALGGVAGHAWLFGRAADVLALALAWAGRGEGPEALDRRTRSVFSTRQAHPCGSTRALGWDTNAEPARGGVPGPRFGPEWFGHTGYTGGALWLREGGDVLLCLCHRTWPRRPSQELGSRAIQAFRKDLYEELARCLPALTRP